MSQAKLIAAKELIQEKRYAEARALLKTINSPTATRWLEQLDRIDPPRNHPIMRPAPPPQDYPHYPQPMMAAVEAEEYYRAENRSRVRRRIGKGIQSIMGGVFLFIISIYLASLPKYSIPGGQPPDNTLPIVIFVCGLLSVLLGFYLVIRARD